MEQEVLEALTSAERDDNVRVIIFTGAGRGFCAGADMGTLNSVASESGGFASVEKRLREKFVGPKRDGALPDFQKTYSYLLDIKKPILGAINGAAAGFSADAGAGAAAGAGFGAAAGNAANSTLVAYLRPSKSRAASFNAPVPGFAAL